MCGAIFIFLPHRNTCHSLFWNQLILAVIISFSVKEALLCFFLHKTSQLNHTKHSRKLVFIVQWFTQCPKKTRTPPTHTYTLCMRSSFTFDLVVNKTILFSPNGNLTSISLSNNMVIKFYLSPHIKGKNVSTRALLLMC